VGRAGDLPRALRGVGRTEFRHASPAYAAAPAPTRVRGAARSTPYHATVTGYRATCLSPLTQSPLRPRATGIALRMRYTEIQKFGGCRGMGLR
jgi:hypothetical protein